MTHAIVRHSPYIALLLGFACSLLLGAEVDLLTFSSSSNPRPHRLELDELVMLSGVFSVLLAALTFFNSRIAGRERRKRAEIEHEANIDTLTSMANRRMFFDRLKAAFDRSPGGQPCAVILLDLDGFKAVNDTCGHAAGDFVLTNVARRIEQVKGGNCLASRLGGDEFALVIEGAEAAEAKVRKLAQRLRAAIAKPMDFGKHRLSVGSSIGLAFWTPDLATPAALLEAADGAMYRVKRSNRDGIAA